MRIVVDLSETPAEVTVSDPRELTSFSVVVTGGTDPAHLDAALRENGVGYVHGDDVLVLAKSVRELVEEVGALDDEWEQGFAKMLEFARTKGWIHPGEDEDDGEAIQAHVEWGEAQGHG